MRLALLPLALSAVLISASAMASSTNFGDFVGDTVVYEDVLEVNGELLSSTGIAISGDTLDFSNALSLSNAEASSLGGGVISASGQINAFIQSIPNNAIDSLDVEVSGNSLLTAFGAVTQATSARALLSVTPRIIDVDGSPLPGGTLILNTTNITLAEFDIVNDGSNNLLFGESNLISIADAAFVEFGITGPITRVLWSITLTLEAESETTSRSEINLSGLDNFTVTTNVPEPSSLALLGLTGCLAAIRRRR